MKEIDQKRLSVELRFRKTETNRFVSLDQWNQQKDIIMKTQKDKDLSVERMKERQRIQSMIARERAEAKREISKDNMMRLQRVF
jgi:hypothetical protein